MAMPAPALPADAALCPHTADFRSGTLAYAGPPTCNCSAPMDNQHKWLRHVETSPVLLTEYLVGVYGSAAAHVNVSLLNFFWSSVPAWPEFDLAPAVWLACIWCDLPLGVAWAPLQDAEMDPCGADGAADVAGSGLSGPHRFPGFFVQRWAADTREPPAGVADDTWVEVMRIDRTDDQKGKNKRCTVAQV